MPISAVGSPPEIPALPFNEQEKFIVVHVWMYVALMFLVLELAFA